MPPERRALLEPHTADDGRLEAQTHPRLNRLNGEVTAHSVSGQTRFPRDETFSHLPLPFQNPPRPAGLPDYVPWPPPPPPPEWIAAFQSRVEAPSFHERNDLRRQTAPMPSRGEPRRTASAPRTAASGLSKSTIPPGRTPSQLEMSRIRSLQHAAPHHWHTSAQQMRAGPVNVDERLQAQHHRSELLQAHRNTVTRAATPRTGQKTPVRTGSALPPRTTPSRKALKGDMPDMKAALRDGIPARSADHAGTATLRQLSAEDQQKAQEYLRGIEDLYARMRDSYAQFRQRPETFSAVTPRAAASPARARDVPKHDESYLALKLASTPVQPSAEARKLREELDRLERQWEQLDARRQGDRVPQSRAEVIQTVHDVLRR